MSITNTYYKLKKLKNVKKLVLNDVKDMNNKKHFVFWLIQLVEGGLIFGL